MRRTFSGMMLACWLGVTLTTGPVLGQEGSSQTKPSTSQRIRSSNPFSRFLQGKKAEPAADPETDSARQAAAAQGHVKAVEHQLQQQIDSIQTRLDREQKLLEARFEQLAKQREAALAKGNDKEIKKIEAAEATTIKDYEQRIQAIVAQSTSTPESIAPPVASNRNRASLESANAYEEALRAHSGRDGKLSTRSNVPQESAATKEVSQGRKKPKFRVWPFK